MVIRILPTLLVCLGCLAARANTLPFPTQKKLKVVATLPDLAAIAKAIGGERLELITLARPGQNLHAVRVKPSHLVAVSRADLFLQVGLSLEHAWVPGLMQTARNRKVLPGTDGFVSAGKDFKMIEVPVRIDRGIAADLHPLGNPHINLSLSGGPHMAERILAGLLRVDPEGRSSYEDGYARWLKNYQSSRKRWDLIAAAVAETGQDACLYHQEFDYLLGEMGLQIVAFLEPKPGLAPTPSHLAKVIETVREKQVPVILTAPWSNNKSCARVAKKTGAKILELPVMCGGNAEHGGWIAMIDDCVLRIARAYGVDADAVLAEAAAGTTDK